MSVVKLLLLSFLTIFTCSLTTRAAETCAYGIRDFGRDFLSAASFTAGGVDDCNTNPDGSFNISCEEVQQADRNAFQSHYDYTLDSNNTGFINCTRINAPEILERLQLQDMAKATADALNCNLAFLNVYDKLPASDEVKHLNNSAVQAFRMIREDLKKNISDKSSAAYDMSLQQSVCHREPGDGGMLPLNCVSDEAIHRQERQLQTIGNANNVIDTLVATVPYGTEVEVREAIIASANADDSAFLRAYFTSILAVRSRLAEFQSRLEKTRRDIVTDGGKKVAVYLNDDQCNTPYMNSVFFGSAQYNALVNSRTALSPRLKQIMTCRRDARKIGASRVSTGLMIASIASVAVSGGTSLAGVGLAASAKTAMVVADLALSGVGVAIGIPQIYENCYNNGTAIVRGGEKCSPSQGLNMAITRTTNAMCAISVFSTASSAAYIAGGPLMAAIKARRSTPPEEVAPPPPPEPETPIPANDNDIVVTGTRLHKKHH